MSENLSYLSGRKGLAENLFEKMSAPGTAASGERQEEIRRAFLIGKSTISGTLSFYDFLRKDALDKKVFICNGSACLTAGTQPALREKLLAQYQPHEIGEVCCLGRCHENAAFQENGKNYSGQFPQDENKNGKYAIRSAGQPVITRPGDDQMEYKNIIGKVIQADPADWLSHVKESGLRGRGGAGFPIFRKLESCRAASGEIKFIVCNADEGDPGAYSDRFILEERPHHLILGMILAGFAAGAAQGVIYIRGEYPEAVKKMEEAVQQTVQWGFLGCPLNTSGFTFSIKIIVGQGSYICGEETALLSSIEGQRPEVRVRPPYPVEAGLFQKPTVVNNVETLACLPFIASNGGSAFAGTGTAKSTGTKLLSLDGYFNQPGILELPMGTPLQDVVEKWGGGFRKKIKALHIGGPLGGLIPVHKISELSVDFESFAAAGFLLGHASIVCIPEEFPLIEYLAHLFRFTAHESCGKCFPCRLGSQRGAEMLEKAVNENYQIDATLFADLLETLESGSLCMLGGGLPLPVRNALQYFPDELNPFFKNNGSKS